MPPTVKQSTDAYIKALQSIKPSPQVDTSGGLTPLQAMIADKSSRRNFNITTPGPTPPEEERGLGTAILDYLTRPLGAAASAIKEPFKMVTNPGQYLVDTAVSQNQKALAGDKNAGTVGNILGNIVDTASTEIGQNLRGEKKTTGADVIGYAAPNAPDWYKGVGGFAMDLAIDPVNLISGGAIGAAGKIAAKGATKAGKTVEEIARAGEKAKALTGAGIGAGIGSAVIAEDPTDPVNLALGALGIGAGALGVKRFAKLNKIDETTARQLNDGIDAPVKLTDEEIKAVDEHVASATDARTVSERFTDDLADAVLGVPVHQPVVQNISRKGAEAAKIHLDSADMENIYTATRNEYHTRVRDAANVPAYINEVNPDHYGLAAELTMRRDNINSTQLIQDMKLSGVNVGQRDAERFIALMRKDGILESRAASKAAAERMGGISTRVDQAAVVRRDLPENSVIAHAVDPERLGREADAGIMDTLRKSQDAQEAKGLVPQTVAQDGQKFNVSLVDVLETMPDALRMRYNLVDSKKLTPRQLMAGVAEAMARPGAADSNSVRAAMQGRRGAGKGIPNEYVDHILNNIDAVGAKMVDNKIRFNNKDITDSKTVAQTSQQRIEQALSDGDVATLADELADVGGNLQRAGREIGASDNAIWAAARETSEWVAARVPDTDIASARTIRAIARDRARSGASADTKTKLRHQAITAAEIRKTAQIEADLGIQHLVKGEDTWLQYQQILDRDARGFKDAFVFGYGTGGWAEDMRQLKNASDRLSYRYRDQLNIFAAKYPRDIQTVAFNALRTGTAPAEGIAAQAVEELRPLVSFVFDVDKPLYSRAWRNGASVGQVNEELARSGAKTRFNIEKANGDFTEMANQWKAADIDDPLSELDKIQGALRAVEAKQAFAEQFLVKHGSQSPKPGYVKLSSAELSGTGSYLSGSYYVPKEAAEYYMKVDSLWNAKRSFRGEKGTVAWLANNLIDPVMSLWKPLATIARPGHHTRNLLSDIVLSSFDGVYSPKYYKRAKSMMQASGALKRDGVEGLEQLSTGNFRTGTAHLQKVYLKGGREENLTLAAGYKAALDHGLFPSHRAAEDLIDPTKFVDKVMDTKYMKLAAATSDVTSNFTRLAHFSALLERRSFTNKFDNLDDAYREAAKRVNEYHPDSTGLTPYESQYMRRLVPFYSWARQSIPLIFSTMLMHPGRTTVIPKGLYNMQVAMGLNPESITQPFPEDKLYPEFIKDAVIGPISEGGMTFDPGTPLEGMLKDFNKGPSEFVSGLLSPHLKAPVEIARGETLLTNKHVDTGQTLNALIPGAQTVGGILGINPLTSVANGTIDQERAVLKGEKDNFFNLNLANFFTGLSLRETQNPSDQARARKEAGQ